MALARLMLYIVSAMCNFSVSLALWRLRPWLAKVFAFVLFSVVVTSVLYCTLLMVKLGWFAISYQAQENIIMANTIISAVSSITLAVVFFKKNGEAGRGL